MEMTMHQLKEAAERMSLVNVIVPQRYIDRYKNEWGMTGIPARVLDKAAFDYKCDLILNK
jgi:hypothetical protein